MQRDDILNSYYKILEQLEQVPGEEQALDSLIDLETKIKDGLFAVLQERYGDKVNKTNIYNKFQSGNGGRDKIESLVMQKTTGDKVSINDLTNQFIKRLHEILEKKVSTQEKIKLLKIEYITLDNIILPPDYERGVITGSGNGFEKGNDFDRFALLIEILRSKGIYTDDLLVFTGKVADTMMRKQSYMCIYIPRIKKTIFVNNQYGEAIFIYDGILNMERFTQLGKRGLSDLMLKVKFFENHKEKWIQRILEELFTTKNEKGDKIPVQIGEKVNTKNLKKREEFMMFYNTLSEEERENITKGQNSYRKLVSKYSEMPKSYRLLITLLGGNNKCQEGGYVEALLKGEKKGEKYFKEWEKDSNKTEKEKREEIIGFYNKLSEEERKNIIKGGRIYEKRISKYPELPQSYEGLTKLLGGNNKCQEGLYLEALLKGEEEGKKYFEEREKRNNKTNKEKREEFIVFYNKLLEEEKKNIIKGGRKYKKRISKYPDIIQTYEGLIALLGGNNKCQEGLYLEALLKGEKEGKKYFEEREKRNNKTNKERREEFMIFYNTLSEEEKKDIIKGVSPYIKLAKKYPEIPQSYRGLITLLGGDNKCQKGGYVEALLKGEEEGKKYFEEWKKRTKK